MFGRLGHDACSVLLDAFGELFRRLGRRNFSLVIKPVGARSHDYGVGLIFVQTVVGQNAPALALAITGVHKFVGRKIAEIVKRLNASLAKRDQHRRRQSVDCCNIVSAMEAIDRAEEKIEQMSARAEAYQELSLEDGRESLDKKFKELEHESPDMDDELMALKQRALPDAQKKLPETTTAPEAPAEEEDKPIIPPVSNIGMFGKMK